MKRLAYAIGIATLPFALVACGSSTNGNSNTVVLDLVNESAVVSGEAGNANVAVNRNGNVNAAAGSNVNVAANANTNAAVAISITAVGFSPSTVTVKAGTVVRWTNASGSDARVASDPHPTHTDLPELDSATLASGDSYSFTFTKVGTWGYHNHEAPTERGTVIVQ